MQVDKKLIVLMCDKSDVLGCQTFKVELKNQMVKRDEWMKQICTVIRDKKKIIIKTVRRFTPNQMNHTNICF